MGEFTHAIGGGGTLPARTDHAKIGIIGLPQHQISGSPSQGSHFGQLIGRTMGLLDIVTDRSVQLDNPFHERGLCLRPLHPGQGIMQSIMPIDPPIDDPDVLQHFVRRHTRQIVERQPSLCATVPSLLDQQIRLPVLRLRTDLGLKDAGHGCIGMVLSHSTTLRLSYSDEILS